MDILLNTFSKVHFIDQTSEKNHHMVFNASMISVLSDLVPNAAIMQYGIASNLKATRELIPESIGMNLIENSIFNPKIDSKFVVFKILNYIRKEGIRIKMFFDLLQKTSDKDLIVLSITTFTSFLGFKILKCFYKTSVLCILHGDIDFLYHTTSRNEKLIGRVNKLIFKIKAPDFYYILLNKIAKERVVIDGYLKESEVFEINHPFITFPSSSSNRIVFGDKQTIIIGHIGSMEVERKNSQYLYEIAKKLKNNIRNNQLLFETIGLITPKIVPYKNQWVKEVVGNLKPDKPDYLSRQEYENQISQLDFAVFFFDDDQYVFRASGAVIDAIAFGIPIIVLKHPFFDNLFEQEGPIGYSCENMEEVVKIIKSISDKNETFLFEYQIFLNNLKKLKQKFSVANVSNDLKKQIINNNLKIQ